MAFSLAMVVAATIEGAWGQTTSNRVALLIANGAYPEAGAAKQTAAKDASLLTDELRRDSFDVVSGQDLGRVALHQVIDAYLAKIKSGSTAFFYFNGVGIQVARQTYLIPVDAQISSEADVKRDGVSIDALVGEMAQRGAKVKIVIVDASRRNVFERRFRSAPAGLASVDVPEGTLLMLSAAPNKVTADPTGDVSLLMDELVKELRTPDISVEDAIMHTRVGVSRASNGDQVPWFASSLVEPLYLGRLDDDNTPGPPLTKAPTTQAPVAPPKILPVPPVPIAPPVPVASPVSAPPPVVASPPASAPQPKIAAPEPPAEVAQPNSRKEIEMAPGSTFRDCPDCPEMRVLPTGSFIMGSATSAFDRPSHRVTIAKPFAIALSEVTFDDWQRCRDANGCSSTPDSQGFGEGAHPVINVSWNDAKEFVAWLSKKTGKTYRLPSEAEWEYAARAGTSTLYYWGPLMIPHIANCADCGGVGTPHTDVIRSYPPNPFGLYDMAGNAAEWVEDCWNASYKEAPDNGAAWLSGACDQRVLRGGSFTSSAAYLRSAARFRYDADVRYWANGFRLVRELP